MKPNNEKLVRGGKRHRAAILGVATAAVTWICAAAAAVDPPKAYPDFDWKDAQAVVVVATVAPGADLPQFEECSKQGAICLHSPLWFKARVTSVLYGDSAVGERVVFTTSHYGMQAYKDDPSPYLIVLGRHGSDFVMPAYKREGLVANRAGKLYLPIRRELASNVLPCAVASLSEDLVPADFPRGLGIGKDEFDRFDVLKHPEIFLVEGRRAFPRKGISIERLQTYLARTKPSLDQMACPVEP